MTLLQAATQRIADILTTSGQAAASNTGSGTTARDGTSSFQQQAGAAGQQQAGTISVPTTFTHDTWNADNYGRRLQQQQVRDPTTPSHAHHLTKPRGAGNQQSSVPTGEVEPV